VLLIRSLVEHEPPPMSSVVDRLPHRDDGKLFIGF